MKTCSLLISSRALSLTAMVAALLLLCPVSGNTAEQKTAKPQAAAAKSAAQAPVPAAGSVPAASGPAAIPVADVATQAAAVSNLLRTLAEKLTISAQIDTISETLPEAASQADQDLTETMRVLQRHPALPTLQAQQEQWKDMQLTYSGWLETLTKRSNDLQNELNSLIDLQKIWAVTLDAAKASKAPGPSLQQINETIASISAAQAPLNRQLFLVLDLQSRVGNGLAKCGTVLAEIVRAQQTSVSDILVRDSLPIWSPELWADAPKKLPEQVRNGAAAYWTDIGNFFTIPSRRMPLHMGFLAVLTLLFIAVHYQVRKWTAGGEAFSPAIMVLDHPVAASLTVSLLIAMSPYWSLLPPSIRNTFQVLALVPMIILIRPAVSVRLVPGLYALGVLFALDAMRRIFSGEQLILQGFLILESFTGMVLVIWFLRDLRAALGEVDGSSRLHILQAGSGLALLILASGFVSAVMGYVRLGRLIIPMIIAGGVLALLLYATLRVFTGIVAFAFRVWPLRTLRMIQHHRELLERRLYHLLVWMAIIGWMIRYLSYIGLLSPVLTFGETLLSTKWERGAFSISPGEILEFILTVWASYLLSAFIRFVLREDIYPRMRIASGTSYAVSSILHYFILALGFTAAIAAMGVNLTKLTVLSGAFGVGLGFGLQGVVNNFVSGLILLFERPVHVGDTVELGDLLGKVRRIGIRASTVHTIQGADIIVPNSQLVSEKVTNWTLSDMLRRIDLPVGVSYSSVPKDMIKVLERVALDHHQILADPPPQALFMGYGDSSINFELRAWTDRFDEWVRIRSELASAVFDAVRAAGMSFPFPQREVRILKDVEGGEAAAAGQETEKHDQT